MGLRQFLPSICYWRRHIFISFEGFTGMFWHNVSYTLHLAVLHDSWTFCLTVYKQLLKVCWTVNILILVSWRFKSSERSPVTNEIEFLWIRVNTDIYERCDIFMIGCEDLSYQYSYCTLYTIIQAVFSIIFLAIKIIIDFMLYVVRLTKNKSETGQQ